MNPFMTLLNNSYPNKNPLQRARKNSLPRDSPHQILGRYVLPSTKFKIHLIIKSASALQTMYITGEGSKQHRILTMRNLLCLFQHQYYTLHSITQKYCEALLSSVWWQGSSSRNFQSESRLWHLLILRP